MADSDNESSGKNNAGGGGEFASPREQDRFLPIANVSRIMKKALPANAKISKDAKETVQECVSEFISFITGEASDKCQREKRKTINGDDLLWAMATLGFEDYVEPLKVYLQRFREMEGEKGGAPASSSSSLSLLQDGGDFSVGNNGGFGAVGGAGTYPSSSGGGGGGMIMMGQQMYGASTPAPAATYQHHQMSMGGAGGMGSMGGGGNPSAGLGRRSE
ncbi:hypothetical protein Taro_034381, partial [Colocasia esculenta]|nr:hypothetical protein [Colocasia esculenta]